MLTEHPPRWLADRYTLDAVIGRGGMADVHRATDTVLEREVAVKLLRMHAATDRDRARFRSEAQLLAALDHPGLVAVLDAGLSEDDVPYLVMELIEGTSLTPYVDGEPMPTDRVAAIAADLAAVLGYVHERDIVHRDVKPGNVLLGPDGRARLADFGIARMLGDTSGHTLTGYDDRDGRLPGPRAGPRRAGVPGQRRLRARAGAARGAHRPPGLHRDAAGGRAGAAAQRAADPDEPADRVALAAHPDDRRGAGRPSHRGPGGRPARRRGGVTVRLGPGGAGALGTSSGGDLSPCRPAGAGSRSPPPRGRRRRRVCRRCPSHPRSPCRGRRTRPCCRRR